VFSVLGHMSVMLDLPIKEVAESGPGLVFIVYPAGIAQMPVSVLWAILFFLMLLTIGLDSQFAMMECVIAGLSDEYPRYLRRYKEVFVLVMCIIAFFFGYTKCNTGWSVHCRTVQYTVRRCIFTLFGFL